MQIDLLVVANPVRPAAPRHGHPALEDAYSRTAARIPAFRLPFGASLATIA